MQLVRATSLVLGTSLVAFSLVLYASFSRALRRQLDEQLTASARAVADMVEERSAGPWELELADLQEFKAHRGAAYFEIWMDDGSVLFRSPSLSGGDLQGPPRKGEPVFSDIRLPDGRPGRMLGIWLKPRPDAEEHVVPSGRLLRVAAARSTEDVDAVLAVLRLVLLLSGMFVLLLSVVAAVLAVRRGLRPIVTLGERMDAMGADSLKKRLPVESLPKELRPPVAKLNDLLHRLERSFAKERRFSADVSHELRTPLSGLRSTLEVAVSRERPAAEYRTAIIESLEITAEMTDLVERLLLLAKLDDRAIVSTNEAVDLASLVKTVCARRATQATERGLTLENLVPIGTSVNGDRCMLDRVATNLISNATTYTLPGGTVRIESDLSKGEVLTVWDSGPPIPEDALEKIFDRFYRVDEARTGSETHSGLGLALTRALCEVLGLSLRAENGPDGSVTFCVRKPV